MITTKLDKPTNPAGRAWFDLPVPAAAGVSLFALSLIAGLVWQLRSAQSVAAIPTPALPAPIIIVASPLAEGPRPTPAAPPLAHRAALPPPNVTRHALIAYGGPDRTSAIGAVEAGRSFSPLGRYGTDWVLVDMAGSGRVFIRTSDLYDMPDLVDLQPPPTPIVVNQPIMVYQQPAAVEPAAPTPAAIPVAQPTLAPQQLIILDREQWAIEAQRAGR